MLWCSKFYLILAQFHISWFPVDQLNETKKRMNDFCGTVGKEHVSKQL